MKACWADQFFRLLLKKEAVDLQSCGGNIHDVDPTALTVQCPVVFSHE